MNCRIAREKLNDLLANGEAIASARDVASHLQTCSACRALCESHANLFRNIDNGIRNLVNTDAPPSLLPRVHDRISTPTPGRTWLPVLVPSMAAVLIVCGLLFLLQGSTKKTREQSGASLPLALQREVPLTAAEIQPSTHEVPAATASSARRNLSQAKPQKPTSVRSVPAPIVIDPREAQGLTRLAEALHQDPEFGKTYLDSLAQAANPSLEIEPLSISEIKIPALVEEKNQ